jgi:outer membrane protein assembly factor BamB
MRFSAAIAWLAFISPALAQDWPNWRGPNHDGSAEVEGLPATFSKTENVKWAASLPGPGAGTPIVIGSRVFLTAIEPDGGKLLAICIDRDTGEERWVAEAGSGYRPDGAGEATSIHRRSNYASPSPATDGERVVFFFGNGDLVAYDLDGERSWARNLQRDYGDFAFQWTFSATPTILGDRLFLPILQRDKPVHDLGEEGGESFLLALEVKSGKEIYRHVRPSEARNESLESFATAIPCTTAGRTELLIVGGDVLTGHDPATGKELWRWGTWNPGHREEWWRVVPSPVVGAGVVLVCAPKGAPVHALRLGLEENAEELLWKSAGRRDPLTSDVPTPLFFAGDFFVLSDKREALTRVDPQTGEQRWTLRLSGEYKWRASPTGADGRIWLIDHGGNVVVIDAKSGEVVHRAVMGEEDDDFIRSTIAVAHGSLFIRTNTTLFCIGSRQKEND